MKDIYKLLIVALLCLSGSAMAQEQLSSQERADRLYLEYRYANAIPVYLRLANEKKPELKNIERLAECYYRLNDYRNAEQWYAKVLQDTAATDESLFRYGQVLKSNGKYREAKEVFRRYMERDASEAAAVEMTGCDSALLWLNAPTTFTVQNEAAVNTETSQFSAFPMADKVAYVSEVDSVPYRNQYGWTGNSFLYVYTADQGEGNGLENPLRWEELSGDRVFHVGPITANRAGDTLYVTRTYVDKKETEIDQEKRRKYRTHNLELYSYHKDGNGKWIAEAFPYNNTAAYSVGHAALSPDGQTLYFVSDMPGGQGGTDIWYCERQVDGSWGEPVNAGAGINTAGEEMFPGIDEKGDLYFSSDGLAGLGGLDVFRSKGAKGQWAAPENLKIPVNSGGDDFAFIVNHRDEKGMEGFLSSNREGGAGRDDIYSFSYEKPKIIIILKGTTYNKSDNEILPATSVKLYAGKEEVMGEKVTGEDGLFMFTLDPEKTYRVTGEKTGFRGDEEGVSTIGIIRSDTLEVALYLDPEMAKGMTFRLENILYDFDKSNIRKDAALILDKLVKIMEEHPGLKIELSSHTDSRGSDAYNLALSDRRAKSAVEYLISRGIARDRMVARGYGETRLLNRCANGVKCSAADHQLNRRTEFTVLDY